MATRLLNTARTARAALLRTPSLSCPSRQALSSLHMPAGAGTPTHNTLTLSPALMAATTSTLRVLRRIQGCDLRYHRQGLQLVRAAIYPMLEVTAQQHEL